MPYKLQTQKEKRAKCCQEIGAKNLLAKNEQSEKPINKKRGRGRPRKEERSPPSKAEIGVAKQKLKAAELEENDNVSMRMRTMDKNLTISDGEDSLIINENEGLDGGIGENNLMATNPNEEEGGLLCIWIVNLVEFEWKDIEAMKMIETNFPGFRAANPELFAKLFLLIFLTNCAELKEKKAEMGDGEEIGEKYKKLVKMGKKVKEIVAEMDEQMEANKLRKLEDEIETALCLLFSTSVDEVNGHPLLQNRRQFAESIYAALKTTKQNED